MRTLCVSLAFWLAAMPFTFALAGEHPSLLLNPEGVARLKQRIDKVPWAGAQFESLRRRVDAALGEEVELPPRGGNWYHWYVCPDHGNRLNTGKSIGKWRWEHVCPVDRKVYKGDASSVKTDFDGCALAGVHAGHAGMIRDAGIVYQVTREPKYAHKARQLLLAYADKYAQYPLHTINNEPKIGGGRVGSQTLDEAVWLIPVCQGMDLVWEALSESDRQTVADRLLLPAARDVILPHRMGVHNIQCWKNSAVGLVGLLLNEPSLVKSAIDDPASGHRAQMNKGVLADGAWWEGAWGYHFYTLSALWPLVEAARNNGIDLYGPEFKRMFDVPLDLAMPDLVLPDFNDSHTVDLRGQAAAYELAYARYEDPRYLAILARGPRGSLQGLCFGVDPLPGPPAVQVKSANHPVSGFAILARGEGEKATWLCLDYGPHGGGHGHPDKLSFVLYAGGDVIAPDGGITSYGTPMHASWYRTSVAHNTLVVDEQDQQPATGKCVAFGSEKGIDYAVLDAGGAYDGVAFVRTAVLLDQDAVLFIDHVAADRPRQLDIVYHQRGGWRDLPAGSAWQPSQSPGYQHLRDGTVRQTDRPVSLQLAGKRKGTITLAGGSATEVITATGVGRSTADRVPVLILRRQARQTVFAWAVSIEGDAPILCVLDTGDPAAAALQVSLKGKTLRILSNPLKRKVQIPIGDGNLWSSQAAFSVE